MKFKLFPYTLAVILASAFSFTFNQTSTIENPPEAIHWYTWEEAIELNEKTPKNLMVDVYTNWCGYCKKMDKHAFKNPKIVKYINENFYPIKLNAEQKGDITFKGETYSYVKTNSRRGGIHVLAYSLLDGEMSYPSIVYMNSDVERILVAPGYRTAKEMMPLLKFANEKHYLDKSLDEYLSTY